MIQAKRLTLRPWREDDAEALFRYASDPRVCELALWPCHTSVDMSLEVIRKIFMPDPYAFAIVLNDTCEAIGCIGLVPKGSEHYATMESEREVGYWIGYPYWSRGITTEALEALIRYSREELGLNSLLITTNEKNVASQRVACKCGFERVGAYVHEGIPSVAFRLKL